MGGGVEDCVCGFYRTRCLAHSGQRMSAPSVMNPLPTKVRLQLAHRKQSLCQ